MEIETKQIDTEQNTVSVRLCTYDQFEILIDMSYKEYKKITDIDLIDCAKIAYNNLADKQDGDKCESAMNLEGTRIYMNITRYEDYIQIDSMRRITENELRIFIQYQAASKGLN